MNETHMKRMIFNPTISFDGVAIIASCVACSIWFGALRETVKQHGEQIAHLQNIAETLAQGQNLQSQNIAALTTLINERTKNGGLK